MYISSIVLPSAKYFSITLSSSLYLMLALDDLKKDVDSLKEFIDSKKILLSTGNSLELFGNYIITNKKIKSLGIFDYVVMYQENRIVKDVNIKTDIINKNIIGFENHLGKVLTYEDIINIDNYFGTYIIGPILARNPELCKINFEQLPVKFCYNIANLNPRRCY